MKLYYSSTYNSTEVYFYFLHKGAAASAATKCKQQYIYWTGTKQFTEKEKCYYFCYLLSFKKREETLLYSLPSSCKKKNLCIAYCAIVLQLYAYYSLAPTILLKTFSILLCILVILPYSILSWLGECHNEIIHTCGGKYCMSSSLTSSLLSNSIWQNCTMWWEFDYF